MRQLFAPGADAIFRDVATSLHAFHLTTGVAILLGLAFQARSQADLQRHQNRIAVIPQEKRELWRHMREPVITFGVLLMFLAINVTIGRLQPFAAV